MCPSLFLSWFPLLSIPPNGNSDLHLSKEIKFAPDDLPCIDADDVVASIV